MITERTPFQEKVLQYVDAVKRSAWLKVAEQTKWIRIDDVCQVHDEPDGAGGRRTFVKTRTGDTFRIEATADEVLSK